MPVEVTFLGCQNFKYNYITDFISSLRIKLQKLKRLKYKIIVITINLFSFATLVHT